MKSQTTVADSHEISKTASDSIANINEQVLSIDDNIAKAHISINVMHQSLTNSMANYNKDINDLDGSEDGEDYFN